MNLSTLPILLLLFAASVGCIPQPDSPAGPRFGDDSEAQLSARANSIWRELGGRPGAIVSAARGLGSPAVVWSWPHLVAYVPVRVNGPLAEVALRYELGKAVYVMGDGSLLSEITMPARAAGAALHTPPSEIASLYAIAEGISEGGNLGMRR